ncbi:MAG: tRNA (adenosine(37)-N6)-dimethylallyltransferase MiaA [Candidatus Pelagibacter sp.]|nr:tRNA (adenosine(37)-N6)-dimethylallyltransferase MiaA [Candidatus Pelagibacter sp.]
MKKKIILLAGPTASGKTKIAIYLAKKIKGEIINADSMQVYKDFQILSSRPNKNELKLAKHHLYGFKSSRVVFSTGKWLKLAESKIRQIVKKGKVPILVGGTGLYFKAITDGISKIPKIKISDRNKIRKLHKRIGQEKFYQKLVKLDPISKNKISSTDTQRTLRAYEVKKHSKKSIYEWAKKTKSLFENYEIKKFFINTPKDQLLKNIELRTNLMIKKKCINEVIRFKKKGLKKSLSPNKIIGVTEIQRFLRGDLDQKSLIELMNIKTRQYAKRQKTWSRAHMSDWHMIYTSNSSILLKKILNLVS